MATLTHQPQATLCRQDPSACAMPAFLPPKKRMRDDEAQSAPTPSPREALVPISPSAGMQPFSLDEEEEPRASDKALTTTHIASDEALARLLQNEENVSVQNFGAPASWCLTPSVCANYCFADVWGWGKLSRL